MPKPKTFVRKLSHLPGRLGLMIGLFSLFGPALLVHATEPLVDLGPSTVTRGWFDPDGWPGTIALIGEGEIPEAVSALLSQMLTDQSRLVIINAAAENPSQAFHDAETWLRNSFTGTIIDPAGGIADVASAKQLAVALRDADAAWFCGGSHQRIAVADSDGEVETELRALLQRGGLIAGSSAGAAILSKSMVASDEPLPKFAHGFDLVPNAIIDPHFTKAQRRSRLHVAMAASPHCFGLGIDESTAVIIRERRMITVGKGAATCFFHEPNQSTPTEIVYRDREIADLTQLRRIALARSEAAHLSDKRLAAARRFGEPQVPAGSLVIVGGGGLPQEIVAKFIALAGGESAHIVYLPTAVPRSEAVRADIPRFLKNAKVASVEILPQMTLAEITTERYREVIGRATGIWFAGGRQWNFVDAYDATPAIEMFHDVLHRGGVIGGSSAGATIQGEYLVRGHPLGNQIMMAEGYEQGLGFLPGAAIDQHFSQRNRFADLVPVITRFPQLLGIGIDEATALVVRGTQAEVVGLNSVHFLPGPAMTTWAEKNEADGVTDGTATTAQKHPVFRSYPSGTNVDLIELMKTTVTSDF